MPPQPTASPPAFFRRPGAVAFSLVEVTIALAILSFGIISVLGLLSAGLMHLQQASNVGSAAFVARDIAAEMTQLNYSQVSTNLGPFYYDKTGSSVNVGTTNEVYEADVTLNSPSLSDSFTNSAVKLAQVTIWKQGVNKATQKPLSVYSFTLLDNGQ